MNGHNPPEMSVIAITPDRFAVVARTMQHLRAQTVRDRLEIVIVAPSREGLQLDESRLNGFCRFRIVEIGRFTSAAEARVAGIRQAGAPLIALTESHCFPEPGWAEALIHAHRENVAVVAPVFLSANSNSLIGWANFLIEYGPWLDPISDGVQHHLPGHNSSYKRDILLQYGERLPSLMEAESALHWDLLDRGHGLRLEPLAKTRHLNVSRFFSSFPLRFNVGRLFAGTRAQQWSSLRRFAYALASPLIPLVRLRRALAHLRRIDRQDLWPRIVPPLAILLAVDGFGELVGYALGTGRASLRLNDLEFYRERYLAPSDLLEANRI